MHNSNRDAFDPTGASYRDGRWHSKGTLVLYAAENISLAALETLIYSGGAEIPPKHITTIMVPDDLKIERAGWMEKPASQSFGDAWVREARSPLLKVPSIAADKMESNYVVNPNHRAFARMSNGGSRTFKFDERFIYLR
jgi:RES domain-containing protein